MDSTELTCVTAFVDTLFRMMQKDKLGQDMFLIGYVPHRPMPSLSYPNCLHYTLTDLNHEFSCIPLNDLIDLPAIFVVLSHSSLQSCKQYPPCQQE